MMPGKPPDAVSKKNVYYKYMYNMDIYKLSELAIYS